MKLRISVLLREALMGGVILLVFAAPRMSKIFFEHGPPFAPAALWNACMASRMSRLILEEIESQPEVMVYKCLP